MVHIFILCVTQCLSSNILLFTIIKMPFVLDHPQPRQEMSVFA